MKLNVQHDVSAKIDLFKETCHKFLSKINDPKIVTERLKKDIIKLVIDEVVIEGESVKIFATIPLPNKIHEREMDKTDIPGTFNSGATLGPVNETNMARIWNKHKQTNTPLKRKVFVGLSGGVDSSVSAYLLKEQGYDVVGVYMRCYNVDGCSERDAEDARRVAEHLGIPFYVWDFEEDYKKAVVSAMVESYHAGRTPNPDVACNKEIKFGIFLKKAREAGADLVATGHYVKIAQSAGEHRLYAAADTNKDQSYFLWTLRQDQLVHCVFPLGDLKKPEVREIARAAGIPTAEKKDSQGICFLGMVDVKVFLQRYIPNKKGDVVLEDGRKVGEHEGVWYYTIGQRKGLDLGEKNKWLKEKGASASAPLYVVSKNVLKNELIVAPEGSASLAKSSLLLCNVSLVRPIVIGETGLAVAARVRYRQPLSGATLFREGEAGIRIDFKSPQKFAAEGQSAVFYGADGEMLGGGEICGF